MARRHWLDPLARRLLIAGGQLPRPRSNPAPQDGEPPAGAFTLAGRRRLEAGSSSGEADHRDAVERDLLALKLDQNPALQLQNAEEVRHAAALGWRLDVNRATASDWARLPGCSADQVDLLTRLRQSGVQLSGPEDLAEVLGLEAATLACWLPLLVFRWYGDSLPPTGAATTVAVNQATAVQLAQLPGLTPERSQRLLRERSRGPFRDLADLGQRLGLPPAVLEAWIGRVSFAPGPAGPELPPAPRVRPSMPAPGSSRPGGLPPH